MVFDAQLILAALDKHFATVDARLDRLFAAQDRRLEKQDVSSDVPGEHHFKASIVADDIHNSTEPSATFLSSVVPDVAAAVASSVAPPGRADEGPEAPLAVRAPSTGEGATEIIDSVDPFPTEPARASSAAAFNIASLTMCSTDCSSHANNVLKPIWNCSLKHLQGRYITTIFPSLSSNIVLSCVAICGHEYQKVLESMINWSIAVLGPLPAYVFDKEKWPPPTQWLMQGAGAHLRPIPWPSFGYCVDYYASHQHKDKDFVLWILWKIPWIFAELVCWSSDACAAMAVITRAHMLCWWWELFQCLSSWPKSMLSVEGIVRWPQTKSIGVSVCAYNRIPLSISFWSSTVENYILLSFTVGESMQGNILQFPVLQWLSVAKVSGQIVGVPYLLFLVHPLTKIVAVPQLFLWDPGGDQYVPAQLKYIKGLCDLQMQHVELSFVKLQFLCSVDWPSWVEDQDILLGYFTTEVHGVFRLCHIEPSQDFLYIGTLDAFILIRATKLLGGQHKISGEVMMFTKRCSVQSGINILCYFQASFFSDGQLARAATHKHIIQLKLGGVDPGDKQMRSGSYMVITLYIFRDSTCMVSANTWLHCTVSAVQKERPGFCLVQILPTLCIVIITFISPWPPLAESMHVDMEILLGPKTILSGQWLLIAWLSWMHGPVMNHRCSLVCILGTTFLVETWANQHDVMEVTLWSLDKWNQPTSGLWKAPGLPCWLIVLPEDQELVEHSHRTSRFPPRVRDPVFKLLFYHLVIEDP